jgi:DNA-binding NarL/FixJ family response regulator
MSAIAARTVRVLTTDDQRPFRQAARALVDHTRGFEVVAEACGGEDAIEATRRLDPDMIILDVRMAGMDGLETARRLSAEDRTRVIVLASSAGVEELADLAAASGASALVRKHWLTPYLLRGLWVAHRRR